VITVNKLAWLKTVLSTKNVLLIKLRFQIILESHAH